MKLQCKKCGYTEATNLGLFVKLIGGAAPVGGFWAWTAYLFAGTGFALPIVAAIITGGVGMLLFKEQIVLWITNKGYRCPKCSAINWEPLGASATPASPAASPPPAATPLRPTRPSTRAPPPTIPPIQQQKNQETRSPRTDTTDLLICLEEHHTFAAASQRARILATRHKLRTGVRRNSTGWEVLGPAHLKDAALKSEDDGTGDEPLDYGYGDDGEGKLLTEELEGDREDWARSKEEGWYYDDD